MIILIILGLALVALGYVIGWIAVIIGLLILLWCGYKPSQQKRVSWHDLTRSLSLHSTRIYLQACINGEGWKRIVYGEPSPGPGATETIYLELNQTPPYSEAQIDDPAFSFPGAEFDRKYGLLTIRDWYAGDHDTVGSGQFIERTTLVEGQPIHARNQINTLDAVPRPALPDNVYGRAIVKFLLQAAPNARHIGNGIFILS